MYTFDYDASGSTDTSVSPMVFNVKVYSVADKYDVPELKRESEQKFAKAVETCWNMDDFPHAVAQVYSSTPPRDEGPRKIVVDVSCNHVNKLLTKQGFQDVLDGTMGFASDMARHLAGSQQEDADRGQKYRCPHCGGEWEAKLISGRSHHCTLCGRSRSDWYSYVVV